MPPHSGLKALLVFIYTPLFYMIPFYTIRQDANKASLLTGEIKKPPEGAIKKDSYILDSQTPE
jgi:hypothetical protein